jgi:CheY-like chemotaxis protein
MNVTRPILHVEDREDDVYLLNYAFKRAGIENPVQGLSNGQQVVDYLSGIGEFADRDRFPLPSLVLLDMQLPQKLGLEVLEWIRQQPTLRCMIVIMLTSSIYDRDVQRAYELGANAFLVKPADTEVLIDMCRALKHFWLVHNTPPTKFMDSDRRSA